VGGALGLPRLLARQVIVTCCHFDNSDGVLHTRTMLMIDEKRSQLPAWWEGRPISCRPRHGPIPPACLTVIPRTIREGAWLGVSYRTRAWEDH
jgi:hypothetical protein